MLKKILDYFRGDKDTIKDYVGTDALLGYTREDKDVIKDYVDAGVKAEKIILTKNTCTATWSFTKNTIVGSIQIIEDLVFPVNGVPHHKDYKNNAMLILSCYDNLDAHLVKRINDSKGIVATTHYYKNSNWKYRFDFIPSSPSEIRDEKIKKILK